MRLSLLVLPLLTLACGDKDPAGAVDTAPTDSGETDTVDPDTDGPGTADVDADGFSIEDGDCDDTDPAVNPGATEVDWDGLDNDCDGERGHTATHLTVGDHHACALDAAGQAHCWGSDLYGQASPPSGAFLQLAASATGTCGLDAAGQVTCWGQPFDEPYVDFNTWIQWNTGGSGAVSRIFWMGTELCGVDTSDQVHCMGPLTSWSGGYGSDQGVVDGHLSAGAWTYLYADGQVGSGGMYGGMLRPSCEGMTGYRDPGAFASSLDAVALDGGREHQCVLYSDGTLGCWGCVDGQVLTPPTGSFTAAGSGSEHGCAVDAAGAVTCWGRDVEGQASPRAGVALATVEGGHAHTCGIQTDGAVVCWGADGVGQSTVP